MGFEDQIPPVPNREQELRYIQRVEKSFYDQPLYRLYMNEALRTKKMEFADRLNQYKKQWYYNFSLGAMIFGTLFVYPCTRLHRVEASGTPYVYMPKFKFWKQNYLQNRNLKQLKAYLFLTFFSATVYAYVYSDMSVYQDEYYNDTAVKVESFE